MVLIPWTKLLISSPWLLERRLNKVLTSQVTIVDSLTLPSVHLRHGSTVTGAQLATRGRRDMSSRVRDVVLSLALCHNVLPLV
jgi:hypothetical protein